MNHLLPALGELRLGEASTPRIDKAGARIGEALAVLWSQVDLEAGRIQITHTVARITGEGLIRKTTKSDAGHREIHIPDWALSSLRTRFGAGIRLDEPIFADALGGLRDPSNVRRSLRDALTPVGSTARRDLGLTLRRLRRRTGLSRQDVTEKLQFPKNRLALIEAGRVKLDRSWQRISSASTPYPLKQRKHC